VGIPITKAQAERKLKQLGFIIDKKRRHCVASLFVNGKKVVVTVYSQGRGDMPGHISDRFRKQLHLSSPDFLKFRECSLQEPGYMKILRDQRII
jgi:hypothetical protein